MMHGLTKLVFLCVTIRLFSTVVSQQLWTYNCYPNDTITVTGITETYPTMHYFAYQSDDGTNCTVSGDQTAGTARITGCDKEVPIYFTISSYDGMLVNQIHGGRQSKIMNITCFQLTEAGMRHNMTSSFSASMAFQESKTINVTYDITSALNVSSALVGEPVEWSITFPSDYTLEVTSCVAYPGTAVTTSNSVSLVSFGCASEPELISDFTTNIDNTVASAVIKAFKFYNINSIYLTCNVKVCPATSSDCDASCGTKKKRSAEATQDGFEARVGRVLYVTDSAPAVSALRLLNPLLMISLACFIV